MNHFNLKWVYYLPSCQAVPSNATEVQSQNCDRSRKTNRAKLFNIHCSLGETKGPQSYAYLLAYLPRSPSSWVRMSSATTYLPVFLWLPTNVKTEPTIGKNKFFKKKKTKKIKFRHLYSGRSLSLSEMNNCEFLNAWTIFIFFTLLMNYLLFNYSRDWTMWL